MDSMGDEEEVQERNYTEGNDALIFLIDATPSMFTPEDDVVAFKTSLQCCKSMLLNKIVGYSKDLVGIIFFGTDKTENELKAQHITTFQELGEPCVATIKKLGQMIESNDFDNFNDTYGHSDDFNLADTLWLCQTMFSRGGKVAQYRVFLFTNVSDPHASNPAHSRNARLRASDFQKLNIDLEVLHMGASFDPSLFYQELVQLSLGDTSADFRLPESSGKIQEMLERVCRQDYKKKALTHLIFTIGGDVEISVSLYNLVRESGLPTKTSLSSETNAVQEKPTTHYVLPDTREVALPFEMNKAMSLGEKEIVLDNIEHKQLSFVAEPGLKLNCFTDLSNIEMHVYVKPAAFIYPNELMIKGSTALFSGLLSRCEARSKAMMCWLTVRHNSTPHWVALVPQLEVIEDGVQKKPPGFHVVYIPFRDDVGNLPSHLKVPLCLDTPLMFHSNSYTGNKVFSTQEHYERERAAELDDLAAERGPLGVDVDDEEVKLMSTITKRLEIKYDPLQFKNPLLQSHWNFVEALALEYDEARPFDDNTKPNQEMMDTLLGDLPERLKKIIADKTQLTEEEAAIQIVPNLAKAGKLASCTVVQIRKYLLNVGLDMPSRPTKPVLMDIVKKHLGL